VPRRAAVADFSSARRRSFGNQIFFVMLIPFDHKLELIAKCELLYYSLTESNFQ
jgi:hypothetical protein